MLWKAVAVIGILFYLTLPLGYFYYGSGCVGLRMLPVGLRVAYPVQWMEIFVRWYAGTRSATQC